MLRVARKALAGLGPAGYTDPEDDGNSLRGEKVVAEAGLLLLAASTVEDESVADLVDELVGELVPLARSERMLLGLALEPALAWEYSQAHVFLTRLGHPDAAFDELLASALGAQAAQGRERGPHRVLEREWLRAGLGGTLPAPPVEGVLAHPIDLITASREDVYTFSHAVMYNGDFGIRPSPWPRPAAELAAEAEAALARCLDQQDYDLAGELLLTWPLTGTGWSAGAAFGFRVLAAVEDGAGFLPSHTVSLERLRGLEGEAHTDYLLATTYHTIFVMGLLCSVALQPDRAPPAQIPTDAAAQGAAGRIEPFLRDGERPPHWAGEYAKLSDEEKDALAPLLFVIAVRRCVEAHQFGSVRELLAICHDLGLSDTPAASQAAELLARLGQFESVLQRDAGR